MFFFQIYKSKVALISILLSYHVDFPHSLPSRSSHLHTVILEANLPCSCLEIISITVIKSRGLKTDPWFNPSFTLNTLLSPSVVLTTVCAPSYIGMATFTNHSSTPAFLRAHLVTSLGILTNVFFFQVYKSKVELLSFTPILNFSCICRTVKIASAVPFPGINPNCKASIFTFSLILLSNTNIDAFI